MGFAQSDCHHATCDECGEGFGYDDVTMHFPSHEELLASLGRQDWSVTGDRTICPSCESALACKLIGHHFGEWSPFDVPSRDYSGRVRYCEHCHQPEYDPPINANLTQGATTMTQRYTSEKARARMAVGTCPECGQAPERHFTSPAFWLPRRCDLTLAGVADRIAAFQSESHPT